MFGKKKMNGPPDKKKLVLIRNICTYPHFFSFLSRCFNSKVPSLKSVNHEICFCFKIKPFIIQSQQKVFFTSRLLFFPTNIQLLQTRKGWLGTISKLHIPSTINIWKKVLKKANKNRLVSGRLACISSNSKILNKIEI